MGKLNILHHKSYHVYNRDNIERVKRDELRAELEAEAKSQSTIGANSEARLTLLRHQKQELKQESSKHQERRLEKALEDQLKGKKVNRAIIASTEDAEDRDGLEVRSSDPNYPSHKSTDNSSIIDPKSGHINFWSKLENQSTSKVFGLNPGLEKNQDYMNDLKKKDERWDELITMRLDKPAHELKPWYFQADLINGEDKKLSERKVKERAVKDQDLKSQHDPLTFIKSSLYPSNPSMLNATRKRKERQASRSPSPAPRPPSRGSSDEGLTDMPALPPGKPSSLAQELQASSRPKVLKVDCSAERLKAQALLERHQREQNPARSEASTPRYGYRDVYNPNELNAIHKESRHRSHHHDRRSKRSRRYWE